MELKYVIEYAKFVYLHFVRGVYISKNMLKKIHQLSKTLDCREYRIFLNELLLYYLKKHKRSIILMVMLLRNVWIKSQNTIINNPHVESHCFCLPKRLPSKKASSDIQHEKKTR